MHRKKITRRDFIGSAGTVTAGIGIGSQAFGANYLKNIGSKNDKVRMGFIGIGNRGTQLMHEFMTNDDIEVTALCDIYEPYLTRDFSAVHPRYKELGGRIPKMGEGFGKKVKQYKDFRKLLEDKNVDAVCIGTPDHWHAIQMIQAVDAGKDVYVEKPLTITLVEGRKMVDAQKRTGRIVTVGLNRRGSPVYQQAVREIQNNKIGKVTVARAMRISNMTPDGIGIMKPEDPPTNFDWNTWLGPRAYRPYQYNICPYKFRWWSDYSTQMGNWGVHYMDAIRWILGEKAPVSISAHGGKYVLKHDGDIPDTMEVLFEFASGLIINFSIHEASGGDTIPNGEIVLKGIKGNLVINERRYSVNPSSAGQFQNWENLVEEETVEINSMRLPKNMKTGGDPAANLIRNFIDCVKSREEPWCNIEEGHRSTSFAHLANIALETNSRIEWDPVNEKILNNNKANELLHYEYRKPWTLG